MANTRITAVNIVTTNSDPKPTVTASPSNGKDSNNFTWTCVGQRDVGATSYITFSILGTASNPVVAAGTTNVINASCQVKAATTNYVQATVQFTTPSNNLNWTINIGSGTGTNGTVRFQRGNGGGKAIGKPLVKAASKPAKKAPAKAARKAAAKAKPAAKRSVKAVAKKTAAKPVRKSAKKATKPARKGRGK